MTEQKRFYWLKLQRDFFKRHDIRIVESMPNGKDYILFYLKLLCESVDHDGRLRFSDQIPYSIEMLATITNTNVDVVRSAVEIFTQLNMMDIMDDGTYFMSAVSRMIGSSVDNDNANRQRRFRENQKQKALEASAGGAKGEIEENTGESVTSCVTKNNGCVTERNGSVTAGVTEDNESKRKSKSIEKELETEGEEEYGYEDEDDEIYNNTTTGAREEESWIKASWTEAFGSAPTPATVQRIRAVKERNGIGWETLRECIQCTARRCANDPVSYCEALIQDEGRNQRDKAAFVQRRRQGRGKAPAPGG